VVDVNAPETVTVAAASSESAAEPSAPSSDVEERPRPSVPELVFSPPPEEQEAPSFAVSPAAELEASTPAEEEREVEPTPAEAAVEEQMAEELIKGAPEPDDAAVARDGAITPAAELEAATPSEEKTEIEASPEETLEEVTLAEDLVEPLADRTTPEKEDETSTEGLASADATDDDAGATPEGDETAAIGGDGTVASKPKNKKKKKKSKSIAK
jgi:hypothetical protein